MTFGGSPVWKCQEYSDFEALGLCHADVTESYHEQIKCTQHFTCNITCENYGRSRKPSHRTEVPHDTARLLFRQLGKLKRQAMQCMGRLWKRDSSNPKRSHLNKEYVVSLCRTF